ncbi:MAG: transposase, partial [bacterium]|nr:transposase [bacterium]
MLELADIVTEYGDLYREPYGDQMLPSPWDALWDIEQCRTSMIGGDLCWCDHCQESLYRYHSCGNRQCPKCGGDRADAWRDRQMAHLLPVPYVLVTFTLPHTLNPVARSNQKLLYDLLFKASAAALKTLALNPTWLGGKRGMVGALHTWDRAMGSHVHVHYVVPAGGIDPETGAWRPSPPTLLVPASALRDVFRAKFRDALQAADAAV